MSVYNSIAEPTMSTIAFGSTLAACAPSANGTASDLSPFSCMQFVGNQSDTSLTQSWSRVTSDVNSDVEMEQTACRLHTDGISPCPE